MFVEETEAPQEPEKEKTKKEETEKETTETGETTKEPDLATEVQKWKQLARKHEARAKANAEKAQQFDQMEEAAKSDLQKAIERAERAETERDEALGKALRARIAQIAGVPVGLLHGTDEADLAGQAQALLNFKGEKPASTPAEGVAGKQGEDVKGPSQITSREALEKMSPEEVVKAMRNGQLNQMLKTNS